MSLIKKNVIVATGVVISNGLAFIFHFVAGRILGPEEYGEFGAMIAMLMVIGLPLSALSSTVTKFISRLNSTDPEAIKKLKVQFQKDTLITIGLIVAAVIIFRRAISQYLNLDDPNILIIIAITGLISLFMGINRGIALGVQNYRQFSVNLVIEALTRLLALFALVNLGFGASGALGAFSIAYLLAFLLLEFAQKRVFIHHKESDIGRRELYRFLGVMLAVQFAIQGSINLPTLYIKHAYSSEFTGYWNAALTIARTILFVTMTVSLVLFTETAGQSEVNARKRNLIVSSVLVLVGAGVMAAIFYYFPEFFLNLLFGAEYTEASDILKWMGIAMIGFGLLDLWSKYYLAKLK